MQRTEQKDKVKNILYAKRSCHEAFDFQKQMNHRANLLKYFPKYIQTIHFRRYDNKIVTNLKRTKIIHKVQAIKPKNKMILQARSFLANKTKAVQKYYNLTDAKQIIQSLRRFPSTQAISLATVPKLEWGIGWKASKTPEALKKEMDDFYQIAKYIKAMTHLQSLDLTFDKKEFARVLKLLDSSKRLKDLEYLGLNFRWQNKADQPILKDLVFEAKNVFYYMTCLDLGKFKEDGSEGFKELPGKCPNLEQINVTIDWNRLKRQGYPEPVSLNYLPSFEAFQKLEKFAIKVGDVETFFRDFTLPISIKSLEIFFCRNGAYSLPYERHSLKEDVKSPDFYEIWSKLKNLESLNILDSDVDFTQELLMRVPKLRVLRFGHRKRLLRDANLDIASFDIASFLKPLEHINKELEVLELEFESFFVKEESIKEIYFPKLERLKIDGKWEKNDLKSYLGLLETDSLRRNRLIEFEDSYDCQSEELFKLLEQLNSVERAEDGVEMSFHLQVKPENKKEWKDEFIKQLQEFTKRGRKMKKVSLNLKKSEWSLWKVVYQQLFSQKRDKFEAFGKLFKEFELF